MSFYFNHNLVPFDPLSIFCVYSQLPQTQHTQSPTHDLPYKAAINRGKIQRLSKTVDQLQASIAFFKLEHAHLLDINRGLVMANEQIKARFSQLSECIQLLAYAQTLEGKGQTATQQSPYSIHPQKTDPQLLSTEKATISSTDLHIAMEKMHIDYISSLYTDTMRLGASKTQGKSETRRKKRSLGAYALTLFLTQQRLIAARYNNCQKELINYGQISPLSRINMSLPFASTMTLPWQMKQCKCASHHSLSIYRYVNMHRNLKLRLKERSRPQTNNTYQPHCSNKTHLLNLYQWKAELASTKIRALPLKRCMHATYLRSMLTRGDSKRSKKKGKSYTMNKERSLKV